MREARHKDTHVLHDCIYMKSEEWVSPWRQSRTSDCQCLGEGEDENSLLTVLEPFGTRQKWWPHSTVNVLYVTEFLLFEVPDFMFFGWPLN